MFCRCLVILALLPALARADAFDLYLNPTIASLVEGKNVKAITQLTPAMIIDHDRVLPKSSSAFLVVRTNNGRWAKLLLTAGKQKISDEKSVPIVSIDRYVTFKEGDERAVVVSGSNQSLFSGFRFSLDLGQVVPEEMVGDLRFVVNGDKNYTEPVGKAKMWLVTKHDPSIEPKKPGKLVVGEKFDASYFNGNYKLLDDGRRSGKLVLKVDEDGKTVNGAYYSDKDGAKYEVAGKIGTPIHSIEFTIKFPRTEQTFKGLMFTGDGKGIAGSSRLVDRESAFWAVREE
jgi:hypothetical protein